MSSTAFLYPLRANQLKAITETFQPCAEEWERGREGNWWNEWRLECIWGDWQCRWWAHHNPTPQIMRCDFISHKFSLRPRFSQLKQEHPGTQICTRICSVSGSIWTQSNCPFSNSCVFLQLILSLWLHAWACYLWVNGILDPIFWKNIWCLEN